MTSGTWAFMATKKQPANFAAHARMKSWHHCQSSSNGNQTQKLKTIRGDERCQQTNSLFLFFSLVLING
tara:strand:- start:221 stop:427 length:207 start_codon:yes stop_codon:yes gene_type:complete